MADGSDQSKIQIPKSKIPNPSPPYPFLRQKFLTHPDAVRDVVPGGAFRYAHRLGDLSMTHSGHASQRNGSPAPRGEGADGLAEEIEFLGTAAMVIRGTGVAWHALHVVEIGIDEGRGGLMPEKVDRRIARHGIGVRARIRDPSAFLGAEDAEVGFLKDVVQVRGAESGLKIPAKLSVQRQHMLIKPVGQIGERK
jgi:hypothetical protein